MSAVTATPRLGRSTHLGYALGSIGTAAFGTVPGLLLLYYLTDVLGVAAGIAGLVVFAPKAWDVVLNPWIGNRSDRTQSGWGPVGRGCWPAGALPPLFVLIFAGPGRSPGVPCHVDACIGGWILPFLGDVPEPFDLSVPGVTSLSVDLHKYGYAPKGVSVLLTATPELRQAHWFATAGWPGYPVVNPTLAGTRPAGAMAAAWAVHRWLGTDGYRALAGAAHEATLALVRGIAEIPGIRVAGRPVTTLVAIAEDGVEDGSEGVDVLNLADEMTARGWLLQPQPPFAQDGGGLPATLHLTVTGATADRVPALLADLADAARTAATLPRPVADPDLVAAAATVDPGTLTVAEVDALLDVAGVGGGRLPERMAPVHALVAALPRPVAERLLSGVLDLVYRPVRGG